MDKVRYGIGDPVELNRRIFLGDEMIEEWWDPATVVADEGSYVYVQFPGGLRMAVERQYVRPAPRSKDHG